MTPENTWVNCLDARPRALYWKIYPSCRVVNVESAEFLGAIVLSSPVPHGALPWWEKLPGSDTTLSTIVQIKPLPELTASASDVWNSARKFVEVQKSLYLALCTCFSFASERTKVGEYFYREAWLPRASLWKGWKALLLDSRTHKSIPGTCQYHGWQGEISLFWCLKLSIILTRKIIAGIDTLLVIMYLAHFSCDVDEQVCKEMCSKDCRPTSVLGVHFSMISGFSFPLSNMPFNCCS